MYVSVDNFIELSDRVDAVAPQGPMGTNPIGLLTALPMSDVSGIRVTFELEESQSVAKIRLLRNTSLDSGSAVEVNSWAAPFNDGDKFDFGDIDPAIKGLQVSYWVELRNFNSDQTLLVGPQTVNFNTDIAAPDQISEFDASHEAVAGSSVRVSVAFKPASSTRFGSVKIYISGYHGVAAFVGIAQNEVSPFAFNLDQTGENITLKAISVSPNGDEAGSGPTKALTLGVGATVPSAVMDPSAAELPTGVQISFSAGTEANITTYQIWRAARGAGFGAALNIGTVAPTGLNRYSFLDTNGLTGQFDWFVVVVNPAGSSAASDATNQSQINTSADLPPNSPLNTTNQATVDSVDAGASATIRVYGTGGVGSSWMRTTGFGTETYPGASLTGFGYSTTYYVMYDKKNAVYVVTTSAPATMPDNYVFAGKLTTVAAGGGGGTGGGGGSTGGRGGGIYDLP